MAVAVETLDTVVAEARLGEALDEIAGYIVRQRWSGAGPKRSFSGAPDCRWG